MSVIAELLKDGKAALIGRGWCRGEYGSVDGRVCALGALIVAAGAEPPTAGLPLPFISQEVFDASTVLLHVVRDTTDFSKVGEYNDEETTTLDDIIHLYDRAIEKANA